MRGELGSDLDKSTSELSPTSENDMTIITFDKLVLGEQYDVLDASHRWCEGEVGFSSLKSFDIFGDRDLSLFALGTKARSKDWKCFCNLCLLG